MNREYSSWFSPHLQRTMELLWLGHSGPAAILFPTSMGRFYQGEDFGLVGAVGGKLEAGELQLVCVDSVDEESWYNRNAHPADRVRRHEQYDRYLRHELIPHVQRRAGRDDLAAVGASFGAYHAANLAGRYPELFHKAVLFSGVYDVYRFVDGYWDDGCYFHSPMAYIGNMDGDWIRRLSGVSWIIATGEHDSLVEDNRRFAALLSSKGIPNHTEIWPGVFGHDWPWWREHLPRFLP